MSTDELLELVNVEGTHDLRGVSDVARPLSALIPTSSRGLRADSPESRLYFKMLVRRCAAITPK